MEQQDLPVTENLPSPEVLALTQEVEALKAEKASSVDRLAELEANILKLTPAAPKPINDLATDLILNPQEVFNRNNQAAADLAVSQIRRENLQTDTLNQVLTDYPKLKDKADPFTGRVAIEYQRRLERSGIPSGSHDANLLKDSAMLVEREDLIAKQNAIDDGTYAPSPRSESGSGLPFTPRAGRSVVTDFQRNLAEQLGLTEAQTVNAYTNRRYSEA